MSSLRVLVVGGGAREHALAAKIATSPRCGALFALPGNAGIAEIATCLPGRADDVASIVAAALREQIDFVVVGPDAAVVAGAVDALEKANVAAFGPSKAAAEIEGSKAFCKRFMKRHGIATADFEVFGDADEAERWVRARGRPMVVKADGLAAGKGVIVASTVDETVAAIDTIMRQRAFGDAGAEVVIEERVQGQEVSFHALCDGQTFIPLAPAQDHKRAYDDDRGPNTGGMGAYSPPKVVTPELHARIVDEVIAPAVRGLAAEGRPFRGALFAGLMIEEGTPAKLHVLEFNARFGDPETAVLLARFDGDLLPYLEASARGELGQLSGPAPLSTEPAVCVVLAAQGYPGNVRTGDAIEGVILAVAHEGVQVFHAGTARRDGALVTAGGRVLCVTARGASVDDAAQRAYAAIDHVRLRGGHFRRDIARSGR